MRKLYILLLVALMASCGEPEASYLFKVIYNEKSILKDEYTIIRAQSDSAAYLKAYKEYITFKNAAEEVSNYTSSTRKAIDFELTDLNKRDIRNINFRAKDSLQKSIEDGFPFINNDSINQASNKSSISESKIDSASVKKLEKYFRKEKDEFSSPVRTWYEPKTAPNYTNKNALFCYFMVEDGKASNLRFRFQYTADDWLFLKSVIFSIDDQVFNYYPSKVERDNGHGGIWEWFDESVSYQEKNILSALQNCKSAKMKLEGSKYYDTKNISKEQIKAIQQTIELYKALGGKL